MEAVDQIETEPKAEEAESQHSSEALKDTESGTADAPQLPSSPLLPSSPGLSNQHPGLEGGPPVTEPGVGSEPPAETSDVQAEKQTAGAQPGEEGVMDPAAKDQASETVSEGEQMTDCGISQAPDTPESEKKPEEKDETAEQSEGLKAVDSNMNLRSIPEKTAVLKLETEIRNEYFQAPPLGQTLNFNTHADKSDVEEEPLCSPTAEKEAPSEVKSENLEKSETASDKPQTQSQLAETKKAAEIPFEKSSPVRQVLNALQSASLTLSSHSRQSPDTADSDDSPSALEMEDIPAGITCVTSEEIKARPLMGLAAPPISFAQREKLASVDLVPDHHLDTACNTSPEGTDLGLSEEEPEMENVLAEAESAEASGDGKRDESSEEQTYSVSMTGKIF